MVAKLYREEAEAQAADDLLDRLRSGAGVEWTARPLGVVPGLPLALTEDLGSSSRSCPARSGLDVRASGSDDAFPVIARAAEALAELHTSGLDTSGLNRRTGADEATKAGRRAALLEQYVPELGPVVRRVNGTLGEALAGLPTDVLRPAHGSYKASQLMVRDGAVFLVDFDEFCLADPALDVGYFLAYLRRAGGSGTTGPAGGRGSRPRPTPSARHTWGTSPPGGRPRRSGTASSGVPRSTRPPCCSRSRRGGRTGCTAHAPERWRRCSTQAAGLLISQVPRTAVSR